MEFFRINDVFIVKDVQEIIDTVGKENAGFWSHDGNDYMMCHYKHNTYVVFNGIEMFNLVGKTGKVIGGVYDKYLEVIIEDKVYNIPHFAIKHIEK